MSSAALGRARVIYGRYLASAGELPLTGATVRRVAGSAWAALEGGERCPAPAWLVLRVSERRPDGAWARMDLDAFRALHAAVGPAAVWLCGDEDPLLLPHLADLVAFGSAASTRMGVDTDGIRLDNDHAHALLDAGLGWLRVRVAPEADEVLGHVERTLLMRDARRLPGPRVELRYVLPRGRVGEVRTLLDAVDRRFTTVEPTFELAVGPEGPGAATADAPDGGALRAAVEAARRRGWYRAAASIDAMWTRLDTDLSEAACCLPWVSGVVGATGDVHPCAEQARRAPPVGNAFDAPFDEAWNGAALRALRAGLRRGRADNPVCAGCRHEDGPLAGLIGAAGQGGAPAPVRR